jgi:hypothetical protein
MGRVDESSANCVVLLMFPADNFVNPLATAKFGGAWGTAIGGTVARRP